MQKESSQRRDCVKNASPCNCITFSLQKEKSDSGSRYRTEIIELQQIEQLPLKLEAVRGYIHLYNDIIPVMDVQMQIKNPFLACDDRTCIVVADLESTAVGLIVETVSTYGSRRSAADLPVPYERKIRRERLTKEHLAYAVAHGEFEETVTKAADYVIVCTSPNGNPQWKNMKKWLYELETDRDMVIFELAGSETSAYEGFKNFKEAVWQNHETPYLRYYHKGHFLRDSNAVGRIAFITAIADELMLEAVRECVDHGMCPPEMGGMTMKDRMHTQFDWMKSTAADSKAFFATEAAEPWHKASDPSNRMILSWNKQIREIYMNSKALF